MHDGRGGARRRDDGVFGRLQGENQRGRENQRVREKVEGVQGVSWRSGPSPAARKQAGGDVWWPARAGACRAHALLPTGRRWKTTGGAPGGLGQNRSWAGSAAGEKPR